MDLNLKRNLINSIAKLLLASQCVPFPGGHGTRFLAARRLCPKYLSSPSTVARAYVCLAMLGDPTFLGRGGDRWSASNWIPYATAWFDQQLAGAAPKVAEALNAIPHCQRWRYVLYALIKVVRRWAHHHSRPDAVRLAIKTWGTQADDRMQALIREWGRHIEVIPLGPSAEATVNDHDESWIVARKLLQGPEGATVQAIYCVSRLHYALGIWQLSLDDDSAMRNPNYEGRVQCYRQLLNLLHNCGHGGAFCETAQALATVMSRFPLIATVPLMHPVTPLVKQLPACFGPYQGHPMPSLETVVKCVDDERAAHMLSDAHHLAEILADFIMDPLRVRVHPIAPKYEELPEYGLLPEYAMLPKYPMVSEYAKVPGFLSGNYTYFDSRARYGQNELEQEGPASATLLFRRLMASYILKMADGRMAARVQSLLTAFDRPPSPLGANEASAFPKLYVAQRAHSCALCRVDLQH